MHTVAIGAFLFALICACFAYSGTPLDAYIALADPSYTYSFTNVSTETYGTLYTLEITSQVYQNASFSDQVLWKHNAQICVPNTPLYQDHAFLMIAGGNNGGAFTDGRLPYLPACAAGLISAAIFQVPNQPMKFPDQPTTVDEDDIIAHTFRTYMNESGANPAQIVLFAMTKAAVRAMDTIQDVLLKNHSMTVSKFVVSGASKRGWTTWLTAAADERVVAIIPVVIPLLNMINNIPMTWNQLGEWGFALGPYTNQRVFDFKGLPEMSMLMSQVDPLSYNDRYVNLKKLIVDSSNDQFFLLDGPKFFWDTLKGPKLLTTIPNTEHSMYQAIQRGELPPLVITFFRAVAENVALPNYNWNLHYSNTTSDAPSISVSVTGTPVVEATQWTCTTNRPGKRDFRAQTCASTSCATNLQWTEAPLTVSGGNSIVSTLNTASLSVPTNVTTQLWTGFLVQVNFTVGPFGDGSSSTIKLTSMPNIFPDFYPYGDFVPDYAAIGRATTTTTSSTTSSSTTTASSTTSSTNTTTTTTTSSSTTTTSSSSSVSSTLFLGVSAIFVALML